MNLGISKSTYEIEENLDLWIKLLESIKLITENWRPIKMIFMWKWVNWKWKGLMNL